jgi:hypothetical protein
MAKGPPAIGRINNPIIRITLRKDLLGFMFFSIEYNLCFQQL